mmetsp:Transcript_19825/g.60133  ORF Transcript_19825/g.60133 Transcript_19825/m.60133 type:complete len:115 (-) Transcript_19825:2730-3074(-)
MAPTIHHMHMHTDWPLALIWPFKTVRAGTLFHSATQQFKKLGPFQPLDCVSSPLSSEDEVLGESSCQVRLVRRCVPRRAVLHIVAAQAFRSCRKRIVGTMASMRKSWTRQERSD